MAKLLLGGVVGPQGPQGTPGVNGSQGPQGIPGPNEIAATTEVAGLTSGQLLYNNGGKVGSVDIVDDLLSIDPYKPLSANQGKILKGLIDDNDSAIGQNTHDISQLSNPNLLINGDFQIWQRGTSFGSGVYSADRWIAFSATGGIQVTRDTDNSLKITASKAEFAGITQAVEGKCRDLLGKKVTISAKVKSTIPILLSVEANGTAVDSAVFPASAGYAIISKTVTLPATINENTLRALVVGNQQIGTINVAWVKHELGDIATPFSPRTIAEELVMCQRYYQKRVLSGVATTTSIVQFDESFSPQLRTTPTVAFTNLYLASNGNGNISFTSGSLTVIDTRAGSLIINGGTTVVGRAYSISDVIFDAEIY